MLNACNNGMSMLVITDLLTAMLTEQLNVEKQFGGGKKAEDIKCLILDYTELTT